MTTTLLAIAGWALVVLAIFVIAAKDKYIAELESGYGGSD